LLAELKYILMMHGPMNVK